MREEIGCPNYGRKKGDGSLPGLLLPFHFILEHGRAAMHILHEGLWGERSAEAYKPTSGPTLTQNPECRRVNDVDDCLSTTPPSSRTNRPAMGCSRMQSEELQLLHSKRAEKKII